jgi:transcriptional regulator with XRE-family HTH domain
MDDIKALNQQISAIGIVVVAKEAGLNKSTISRYVNGERNYSLKNFSKITSAVEKLSNNILSGQTSARIATERVINGEDWQIAYFDFIDSFLATKSELLLKDRPADGLNIKFLALICSIVMQLCLECKVPSPEWAQLSLELEEPWFVSRFESLRAFTLATSPLFFKRNNIFVGEDFLKRA